MPIRFRCAYCNQLLGIARRKAGSVVKCPTCSGQVVVPTLEEVGDVAEPKPAVNPAMFEGNEIDRMLEGAAGDLPSILGGPALPPVPTSPAAKEPPAAPMARFAPAMPNPAVSPVPSVGIYLSPARATLWSVGLVLALAVAFGGGLLAGMYIEYHRLHPNP